MAESHVLVLVGETAQGERGDFYRWSFEGLASVIAGMASADVLAAMAASEDRDGESMEAWAERFRAPGTRWLMRCSCRWESERVGSARSLWIVAMLHLLAHS